MTDVSMRRMLESGVHFGHQTRFWNPKMAPFIFGERNRIHIINLERTLPLYNEACEFIRRVVADGGTLLFVGSKRAARQAVSDEAIRCNMPFVSHRWLGGMLTNFKTIRKSVTRLKELEEITADGARGDYTKKEILGLSRERDKLERALGGIKDMEALPDAIFIIDVGHEEIAVKEAAKLGIPIVAVVDTNSSPDEIDYVVPGNDDAMSAIKLYAHGAAEAVLAGKASIPEVPVGDDEFVELDEEGRPKVAGARRAGTTAAGRKRPARKAVVRKKQSRLSLAAVAPAVEPATESAAAETPEAPANDPAASEPAETATKDSAPAEPTEAPADEATAVESADASAEDAAPGEPAEDAAPGEPAEVPTEDAAAGEPAEAPTEDAAAESPDDQSDDQSDDGTNE